MAPAGRQGESSLRARARTSELELRGLRIVGVDTLEPLVPFEDRQDDDAVARSVQRRTAYRF